MCFKLNQEQVIKQLHRLGLHSGNFDRQNVVSWVFFDSVTFKIHRIYIGGSSKSVIFSHTVQLKLRKSDYVSTTKISVCKRSHNYLQKIIETTSFLFHRFSSNSVKFCIKKNVGNWWDSNLCLFNSKDPF